MLDNSRLGKQFRNVMKIFGVAVAVYFALTLKIGLTGENDEVVHVDYLTIEENKIQEEKNNLELQEDGTGEHEVSSAFAKLCSKYLTICNKIKRIGTFEDKDKSMDFAYVTYVLQYMDKNIKRGKKPSQTLQNLVIYDGNGSRRGSSNRNTITMYLGTIQYNNEFFQVVSHEMGHIIDLGGLQGVSNTKSSNYTEFNKEVFSIDDPSLEYYKYSRSSEKVRKSGMTKEDFCSGYGMSDPFEDFAECNNLYLNHHDYFHKIALNNDTVKNKYNYFSNLYGGQYINNSEANYENWTDGYRARDTTKLREG